MCTAVKMRLRLLTSMHEKYLVLQTCVMSHTQNMLGAICRLYQILLLTPKKSRGIPALEQQGTSQNSGRVSGGTKGRVANSELCMCARVSITIRALVTIRTGKAYMDLISCNDCTQQIKGADARVHIACARINCAQICKHTLIPKMHTTADKTASADCTVASAL